MSKRAFIFGLLVVVVLIIGLYRAKDGARESSADIVRLETEIAEAYRQKALLEADLAHMSRREWIEEYARSELGMGPARASQYASEYNLDLLVGRPEDRQQGQTEDLVIVPVPDASISEREEGAGQ